MVWSGLVWIGLDGGGLEEEEVVRAASASHLLLFFSFLWSLFSFLFPQPQVPSGVALACRKLRIQTSVAVAGVVVGI